MAPELHVAAAEQFMVVVSVRIHSFYFSMLQHRGGYNMCVGETKISYHMWELINKLSVKM